jgi:pectate lyase
VKWIAPNGDRLILSNLASQQTFFRTLVGLTAITGDPKYKQAAMDAIKYAFENLRTPNGLLYWGNWVAYDMQTDDICKLYNGHILKHNYLYYELMWQVDSKVTEEFVESFWSAHIVDWSNLDMNRIGSLTEQLEKAWEHNYEGRYVFFKSKLPHGLSFHNTGSDLYHAGSLLHKLSGKTEPLVWSKRLAHRYVETRDPKIGISGQLYSQNLTNRAQNQFGEDFKDHLVLEGTLFPAMPISPLSMTLQVRGWICQFILGDLLGADGTELTQWALEELTAWGKVAYHKEDNSFVPMLTDGTSLVGYVLKKDGYYGPKGLTIHAMPAGPICFWAYALAYRSTGDSFMWEIARSIARGNNFGDIGASPTDQPDFQTDIESSDPYALLGFLELCARLQKKQFLKIASKIGDNILSDRFHMGFFVPSKEALYTKFDYVEPLVLLHLDANVNVRSSLVPQVWPSRSFFSNPYSGVQRAEDTFVIYSQTKRTELLTLLRVAAWEGRADEVEKLISNGADVNAHFEFDSRIMQRILGAKESLDIALERILTDTTTPLHLAAERGHKDIVALLIAKGADVNTEDNDGNTPGHIALDKNNSSTLELLIAKGANFTSIHLSAYQGDLDEVRNFIDKGADVNAKNKSGETPLHKAAIRGHKDVVELLIDNAADINARGRWDYTPMFYAAWSRSTEVVELLVEKGADVNAKDEWDWTPLHYMAQDNIRDMAEFLITKGASVNAEDKWGVTPLQVAKDKGHTEIVELLKNTGLKNSLIKGDNI